MPEQVQTVIASLKDVIAKLGPRRLIALALMGVALFGAILFSSFYLTRPSYETLYVGLSRDDINRIGLALGEAGMKFDVSADGGAVRVPVGTAGQARMLLAEKGLPTSNNAGYELFDNMGSLGLTSFMQEVTKQRALEGEIARTIQAVQGVKAARVHIVLPDKGSFRRPDQQPTASVIIRTEGNFARESAQSIRQLVAAAVPSLRAANVTIMDTSGRLLSGDSAASSGSNLMAGLEGRVASEIEENIRRQLVPVVGLDHFQISVQVALNTDRQQTNETIYDPDSRVERSVRNIREKNDSSNSQNNNAVSVEQNIPRESLSTNPAGASTDKRDRQEETANYEINTKVISTVRDGYSIDKLAVAVVLDRSKFLDSNGSLLSDGLMQARLKEIQKMIATAAGIDNKRGDLLNVSAIDFIAGPSDLQPIQAPFWQSFNQYASGVVNGLILIIAVLLILFFGVRPLMREFDRQKAAARQAIADQELEASEAGAKAVSRRTRSAKELNPEEKLLALRQRMRVPPQNRLEKLVEMDEERFAGVLRDWIHEKKDQKAGAL